MTYEQMTSFADMQRRQLMTTLAAFFVVMVCAILFSTFLITRVLRGEVANALNTNANSSQIVPAVSTTSSTDSSGCTAPAGEQASSAVVTTIASTGGAGGGGSALMGGRGSGGAGGGGMTITGGTFSWSVSRNVNSDNVFGSYNGSNNTATTTNTQGSNNTVSGHGELNQLNLASNEAENDTKTVIKDSGNVSDSNNNKEVAISKTIDSGNTETVNVDKSKTIDSNNTETNNINVDKSKTIDSGNTTTVNNSPEQSV